MQKQRCFDAILYINRTLKCYKQCTKTWSKHEKHEQNRKDSWVTFQMQCISRWVLDWSRGKVVEIMDFRKRSWRMDSKNVKHCRRTHQNCINIWILPFQSHRKSFMRFGIGKDRVQASVERFLQPWREASNTGNDTSERVLMQIWRSVDGVHFAQLHYRIMYFPCSFRGDLSCISAAFCSILDSHLTAWSRCMNGLRSNSKRVILITFCNVFCTGKFELPVTFGGVPEK